MDVTDSRLAPAPASRQVPAVPWGILDIVLAIIVAGLAVLVLNLVALGLSLVMGVSLEQNGSALAIFLAVQDLIVVGAALLFSTARYRVGFDRLGLRPFSVPAGCAMVVALLMASYAVRALYAVVAMAFGVQISPQAVLSQLDVRGAGFIFTFIAAAVIAPIAEETFFRGFMYGGLRKRIGVVGAMLVSTIFFTALHLSADLFVPIFFLGLFLAWLYEYTGSLFPGMLLHAANNAISLILLYVAQSSGLFPH
ncbi:MAG: CPBP family intramembrane metalloprotease [Chloroflexi bacterium]|nr:CPBP family intramembrane metalloprotease [Chloroflexota bacterium]MCL5952505.1 CPBP family intramembrane metalloprotease [Chloroflexota bacterium]